MKKFQHSFLIIFISFLFVASIAYIISTSFLDKNINDYFIKQHTYNQKNPASKDIVLVIIDDKSIEAIRWPWARTYYTAIFDFLQNYGKAKVIAFDAVITSPDSYNPKADAVFYKSLPSLKTLVAGFNLYSSNENSGDILPSSYNKIFNEKSAIIVKDCRKTKIESNFKNIVRFPKEYIENVPALGSVMVTMDNDGIIRRYMPIVGYKGNFYPSLALSAYSKATGINNYVLYDNYLCSDDNCRTLKMPIDQNKSHNAVYQNVSGVFTNYVWSKPNNQYYSHDHYSAIDIIKSYQLIKEGKKPIIDPSIFKDKIVVVGGNASSQSLEDKGNTPILLKHSGVDIQATAIDNMLNGKFYVEKKSSTTLLVTIMFAILVFFMIKNFSVVISLGFASILTCSYIIFYSILLSNNVEISLFAPIITSLLIIAFGYSYKFIVEGQDKEKIQNAMSKYISKDVMQNVMRNIDHINVGGVKSEVTILFADIRNFTSMSENLSADEVTKILNEYFSAIEPIITKYDGILNKFIGDAVMAIFGEPIKNKNHAANAVKCAAQIQKRAKELQEKWLSEGKPKISIGIGINTGEVFVGNIGSDERLEYTVIGDAVNLAHRIEGYNKVYKTQFLISENTYKYISNIADVIKISDVSIRGKAKKVDIYEVLRMTE